MIELRKVLIVSAIAATGMAGGPLTAFAADAAPDEQQRRLEARVEELERQLRELTQKMSGTPAENPETTITPFGGGTRIASDDNNIPDFTAAYTWKLGSRGFLRAAGLVRQLEYETTGATAVNRWPGSISGSSCVLPSGRSRAARAVRCGACKRSPGIHSNKHPF